MNALRLLTLAGLIFGVAASAQQGVVGGSYTADQATRGRTIYQNKCAGCHLSDLRGSTGPELTGPNFSLAWGNRPARELLNYVSGSMPPDRPVGPVEAVDLVAFILQVNGHTAGTQPLRVDAGVRIGSDGRTAPAAVQSVAPPTVPVNERERDLTNRSGNPNAADAHGPGGIPPPFDNREVKHFTPVTDNMLRNPPPGDWLSWRRTLDGQGYSQLNQISRDNVSRLRMAWSWTMADGRNQATPLVHDGVMYLTHPGNIIQALDAKTGDIIWEFNRNSPHGRPGGQVKAIAMYKDKLFMAASDAAIVAIDARTGKLAWETQRTDPALGYGNTGGPLIAGGVVVSGISGCGRFRKEGCFITGHDPDTGKELWRTSTIALPGDPNDATWGKLPPELRAGGDTWIPGSYDPELNLFYIGTAQAKPWLPASRGTTAFDAVLYTNSTLALDPKTGKIAWYFQHVPAEAIDLDVVFERVLVDLDGQKLLFTIGKDGILWKLNRQTGAFVGLKETMFQNVFDSVDSKTGKLRYRADIIEAKVDEWIPACPGFYGGHNWQATAYSPETTALIIPLFQSCYELKARKTALVEGSGAGTGYVRFFEMPGSDGNLGRLTSIDLRTMTPLWSHEQPAAFMTGVLTTAGGLAFVGDVDRRFKAFDVTTGKVLWEARLGSALQGFPITYSVDGKQYVAVTTGNSSYRPATRILRPDIYSPPEGQELYVFELPD